jgi:hypothetical protein
MAAQLTIYIYNLHSLFPLVVTAAAAAQPPSPSLLYRLSPGYLLSVLYLVLLRDGMDVGCLSPLYTASMYIMCTHCVYDYQVVHQHTPVCKPPVGIV